MTATLHCIKRAKERMGINRKSAHRQIKLAFERGKCAEDFVSWERSYLENQGCENCVAVAYNNYCYIIDSQGNCVTLYPLPAWFGKKKRYDGKERVRNPKVYAKFNRWENDFRSENGVPFFGHVAVV